ncbi:MAG: HypC/HybG/HupF family hydrogenase formation chaperone [Alphaproteobacteria bacterium]|nr:HypC/HybG/HupF family hydrogenase formation chaperone [Alphaproteobacteria bacterium]
MCLAVPGHLVETRGYDLERIGLADFGGVRREVSLAFVPEAVVGDYVLVHVGVAIARLDEAEAARTFAELAAAGVVE